MNNYPIDAQIYVSKMMDFFETVSPQLCLDEEIENEVKFLEMIEEGVMFKAIENIIDHDEPMLDEEQIEDIIRECVVKYHLDSMIESGLIIANVDVETGENVYSLTSKGKKKQKTL
jgi:hypothetical protein